MIAIESQVLALATPHGCTWVTYVCNRGHTTGRLLTPEDARCNRLFPPSFELGTFRVLGERDNHYTTETLHDSSGAPGPFTIFL